MSAIIWHTSDKSVRLSGAERGLMGCLTHDIFMAAIGRFDTYGANETPWILKHIPASSWLHQSVKSKMTQDFRSWSVTSGDEGRLVVNGEFHRVFSTVLNTALVAGSGPIKLMARLHGQSELHCWVEGKNREWLASIIDKGFIQGVFRDRLRGYSIGWEDVMTLLRSADDSPVVCSYSVCESFPNRKDLPAFQDQEGEEEDAGLYRWEALSDKERWDLAMLALRANHPTLELDPDAWEDYHFDNGLTAFDLVRGAYES